MYVANRVDVILNHTEAEQWRHVGSHEHPADIASRRALLKDLLGNNLWWQGPDSLRLMRKIGRLNRASRSPMRLRKNSNPKTRSFAALLARLRVALIPMMTRSMRHLLR
jgi:hypothetical protein